MFTLNDTVYAVSHKKKKVITGTVVQLGLSTDGHIMVSIVDAKKEVHTTEQAITFKTAEEAHICLKVFKEISGEMDVLAKDFNKKMNDLRTQLIGEPEMPSYVKG